MSNRITINNLRTLCEAINVATESPREEYRAPCPGNANVGNYHIDCAYGAYALERTVNADGGVTVVLSRDTARGLYERMQAYLRGFCDARAQS